MAELKQTGCQVQPVVCDVTSYQQQQAMFAAHDKVYGSMNVACLNAGIFERGQVKAAACKQV